jgi:hypothetical protein
LHLFNRLFHAAEDPCFAEAARFWFRRCLQMRQPGRGVAGFSVCTQRQDGVDCWLKEPGLLTGAAGIALALLAALIEKAKFLVFFGGKPRRNPPLIAERSTSAFLGGHARINHAHASHCGAISGGES